MKCPRARTAAGVGGSFSRSGKRKRVSPGYSSIDACPRVCRTECRGTGWRVKLRLQCSGALYHVQNRREAIFHAAADRQRFLETLGEACDKTGWPVHAYCLIAEGGTGAAGVVGAGSGRAAKDRTAQSAHGVASATGDDDDDGVIARRLHMGSVNTLKNRLQVAETYTAHCPEGKAG